MSERPGNTPFPRGFDLSNSLIDMNREKGNDHVALLPIGPDGKSRLLRWFPKPNSWDWIGTANNAAAAKESTARALGLLGKRDTHHALLSGLGVQIIEHEDFIGQSLSARGDTEVVIYSIVPFLHDLEPVQTHGDYQLLRDTLTAYIGQFQSGAYGDQLLDIFEAEDFSIIRSEQQEPQLLLLDVDPKLVTAGPHRILEVEEQISSLIP